MRKQNKLNVKATRKELGSAMARFDWELNEEE